MPLLPYPVGTSGTPWGAKEKKEWLSLQKVKRQASEEIYKQIDDMRVSLKDTFEIIQYGALSIDPERYPVYVFRSKNWDDKKKRTVMCTGGVHGYETSGVQGALRFLSTKASQYTEHFNVIVFPCLSPWGYETINRWDFNAVDPNRNFVEGGPAEEAQLYLNYLYKDSGIDTDNILMHIDLHETTDSDNGEFIPALSARDAIDKDLWATPDGFYLVGDTLNPQDEFQRAVLDSVEKVTHIAEPSDGSYIGTPMSQFGCINYACKELGLCGGSTQARFVTTTECYPDSEKPHIDDENCTLAQVAAVVGAIEYVIKFINK